MNQATENFQEENEEILKSAILQAINNESSKTLIDFYDIFLDYAIKYGIIPLVTEQHLQTISYLFQTEGISKVQNGQKKQLFAPRQFNIIGLISTIDSVENLYKDQLVLLNTQYNHTYYPKIYKDIFKFNIRQQMIGIQPEVQNLFSFDNIDYRAQLAVECFYNIQMFQQGGLYIQLENQFILKNTKSVTNKLLKEILKKPPKLFIDFFKKNQMVLKPAVLLRSYFNQIIDKQYHGQFLEYLYNGVLVEQRQGSIQTSAKTEQIKFRLDTFQLRVMKYVFSQNYGSNIDVIFANNSDQILRQITPEQRELFKKQVDIFLTNRENSDCSHHQTIAQIRSMNVENKIQEIQKLLVKCEVDPKNIQIGYIFCKNCNVEMICGHEVCEMLQDPKQYKTFLRATRFIDAIFNICTVCGIQVIQDGQRVSNISKGLQDKIPKFYSVIWNIMNNVLKYAIKTKGIMNKQKIFLDMTNIIYPMMKENLKERKMDEDYRQQKMYHIQVLVCAYFNKLSGENLIFSASEYYKNIKNILTNLPTFTQNIIQASKQMFPEMYINAGVTLEDLKNFIRKEIFLTYNFTEKEIESKIEKYFSSQHYSALQLHLKTPRNDHTQKLLAFQDDLYNRTLTFEYTNINKLLLNQIRFSRLLNLNVHKCNQSKSHQYKPEISYEKAIQLVESKFVNIQCIKFCPQSGLEHIPKGEFCINCGYQIEAHKFPDSGSDQQYYDIVKTRFLQQNNPKVSTYLEVQSSQEEYTFQYNNIDLEKIALKYQIQPIYFLNYSGFDYIGFTGFELKSSQSSISESNEKDQHIQNTLEKIIDKTTKHHENSSFLATKKLQGRSHGISDLKFLENISCEWGIFSARLRKIHQNIICTILDNFELFSLEIISKINKYFSELQEKRINNYVKCQIYIYWFFKEIFSQIEHNQTPNICKQFLIYFKKRDQSTTAIGIKQVLQVSKTVASSEISEDSDQEEAESEGEKSDMDMEIVEIENDEGKLEPEQ